MLDRTSTLMLKHLIYSVHTGIAHPHLYAEAFNIAIMGCSDTRPMGCSVIVDELWHTYRKIGRRRASQDVPANARRRPGHGFVDELWHTSKSGDAAHPRMSPLMHDAATGMVSPRSSFLYMNRLKHDSNVIGLCPNQCRENRRTWNKSRHCIFNTPL